MTTLVEVVDTVGTTRAWVPVPLMVDTDYFRRQGADTWKGNAATSKLSRDDKYDAGFVYAEWAATEKAPVIEIVSRFSARDRFVDVTKPPVGTAKEDQAVLRKYLEPTRLIPTDGIVLDTSMTIVKGQTADVAKARAIYEWIVDNTFRDPKVKGCGLGDIKTHARDANLGGKCADLNALYVGLARAAGLPARDVYGLRVRRLREFTSLGRSGDITQGAALPRRGLLAGYGWVPVDPADVRKVVLEEKPGGIALTDPQALKARGQAVRIVGDELDRLQLRPRPQAAELHGQAGALPHVSAGRGRRRAQGQPRPGDLQVHDRVARIDVAAWGVRRETAGGRCS